VRFNSAVVVTSPAEPREGGGRDQVSLASQLQRAARNARDVQAVTTGRVAARVRTRLVGRAIARMGIWRRLPHEARSRATQVVDQDCGGLPRVAMRPRVGSSSAGARRQPGPRNRRCLSSSLSPRRGDRSGAAYRPASRRAVLKGRQGKEPRIGGSRRRSRTLESDQSDGTGSSARSRSVV
jgi:hypothetical protein